MLWQVEPFFEQKVKLTRTSQPFKLENPHLECVVVWVGVEMHFEVYHMKPLSKIQKWESNSYNWNNGNDSCYQPLLLQMQLFLPYIIRFPILSWSHVSQKSTIPIFLGSWVVDSSFCILVSSNITYLLTNDRIMNLCRQALTAAFQTDTRFFSAAVLSSLILSTHFPGIRKPAWWISG